MTTTCADCQADRGVYDFANDCCLVRFILHVPLKAMRTAYLEQWTVRYGEPRIAQVKILITEAWASKRREALSFGKIDKTGKA